MIVLGINAFHGDSSAALVRDGELVAAVEEERFRRVKHWAGFPVQAIASCLEQAGASPDEVDHLALNQNGRANLAAKLRYLAAHRPDPKLVWSRLRTRRARSDARTLLRLNFPLSNFKGRFHRVEHHLAHLSSAFHVSPFEEAATVSVDGFGDFSSAAWGVGRGTAIEVHGRVNFPHSLGIFYQAMTQYLGFPQYGDEYKVMGLAPYGRPAFGAQMRQIVQSTPDGGYRLDLRFFRHHTERIAQEWEGGSPTFSTLFTPDLEALLGPARKDGEPLEDRHRDIAHSVQAMYEDVFFNLLGRLYDRYQLPNLTIAGGCGMNSVANGKVRRRTRFKKVYVQSAAGDAGGAIGAAFSVWHGLNPEAQRFHMRHAYWGPSFSQGEIASVLDNAEARLNDNGCQRLKVTDEDRLCALGARAIADGKVVGWFQGRMEWGPRALGNRSILGDPRRADMKDILNRKIKRRESFRPFAPSVLREVVSDWFEEEDDVPFMMQVFQVREEQRARIPAVTHVDGSGRLQTVERSTNPLYWALIDSFRRLTGVPMVLNTSFNENEPVVCRPEEALDCFLRTKMDVLVLGDWMVERQEDRAAFSPAADAALPSQTSPS